MAELSAASVERSQPEYVFDFCGGHLAVDFTNTVGSRGAEPEEHFHTYGDIVAWAEAAGVINRPRAAKLRAQAAAHPEHARHEVQRALELREVLYHVFAASARRRALATADLASLNRFVRELYTGAALAPAGSGFTLETASGDGLDQVLRAVVRAAVDLLTSDNRGRLGLCAAESCAWLFLDTTRSGTRRWCDMKVCGNRHKVRRFRRAT